MHIINFDVNFKKSLSNIELAGIEHVLNNFDEDSMFVGLPEKAEYYGLAYTSSGCYGMYNVTEEVCVDVDEDDLPIYLSHIAITENDMLVFVAYDCYDGQIMYEIEPNDWAV